MTIHIFMCMSRCIYVYIYNIYVCVGGVRPDTITIFYDYMFGVLKLSITRDINVLEL